MDPGPGQRHAAVQGEGLLQDLDRPSSVMEGNIVFRQGDRVIYANRMYYNVRSQTGIVLDAMLESPVPTYQGALRLRSKIIEQVGPNQFVASESSMTSSRLGVPSYDLRTGTISYTDQQAPVINPLTGQPEVDPTNNQPLIAHNRLAVSRDNALFVGPVQVFCWPYLATDLSQPNYYLDNIHSATTRFSARRCSSTSMPISCSASKTRRPALTGT